MAIFKTLLVVILSTAIVNHLVQSDDQMMMKDVVDAPLPQQINCDEACSARCRLSSRPRLCQKACGTCCTCCHCVPPGTSGNYDVWPCYANMTTPDGRHKCP